MLDKLFSFLEALPFVHPVISQITLCDLLEAGPVEMDPRDFTFCNFTFPLFQEPLRIGFPFALCGFLVRPPVAIILDPVD